MIPKSGNGFRKRSCSSNKVERDDDSKKSHSALARSHDATLRFRRRKRVAGRRAHSLVDEPLEAPAVEVFAHVDVAFAVDREGMRHVQRSAEYPLLSNAIDDLERLTQKNPDVVVGAVDHIEEALIRREREPRSEE